MSYEYQGKVFASKTACAKELVEGGLSVKVAAASVGIAYQTVYVNTVGKKNRIRQMAKRRAKKLASSGRNYSQKEIAKRTGLGKDTVRSIFKNVVGNAPAVVKESPVADVSPEIEDGQMS